MPSKRGFGNNRKKSSSPFYKNGPIKETTKAAIKDKIVESAKRSLDPFGIGSKVAEYGSKAANYISRMDDGDKVQTKKSPQVESVKASRRTEPSRNLKGKPSMRKKEARPSEDREVQNSKPRPAQRAGKLEPAKRRKVEHEAAKRQGDPRSEASRGPRSEGERGKGTGWAN